MRVALETVAWWGALFLLFMLMLPFLASNAMNGNGPSDNAVMDLGICIAISLPAFRLLFLLWKHRPTIMPCRIAAFAALLPLLLPGLALWDYVREAGRMRRAPTREIVRTVDFPESI